MRNLFVFLQLLTIFFWLQATAEQIIYQVPSNKNLIAPLLDQHQTFQNLFSRLNNKHFNPWSEYIQDSELDKIAQVIYPAENVTSDEFRNQFKEIDANELRALAERRFEPITQQVARQFCGTVLTYNPATLTNSRDVEFLDQDLNYGVSVSTKSAKIISVSNFSNGSHYSCILECEEKDPIKTRLFQLYETFKRNSEILPSDQTQLAGRQSDIETSHRALSLALNANDGPIKSLEARIESLKRLNDSRRNAPGQDWGETHQQIRERSRKIQFLESKLEALNSLVSDFQDSLTPILNDGSLNYRRQVLNDRIENSATEESVENARHELEELREEIHSNYQLISNKGTLLEQYFNQPSFVPDPLATNNIQSTQTRNVCIPKEELDFRHYQYVEVVDEFVQTAHISTSALDFISGDLTNPDQEAELTLGEVDSLVIAMADDNRTNKELIDVSEDNFQIRGQSSNNQ